MADVSGSGDISGLSLQVLYVRCIDIADNGVKAPLAEAVETFSRCLQAVETHGLFSSNEDLDDVPTSHLRYFLVPHMFGQFLSGAACTDPEQQRSNLQQASRLYSQFLQQCESYGLLGELGRAQQQQLEEGRQLDPNSRRAAKIERFKREKALDMQLQRFQHMMQQQQQGADKAAAAGEEGDEGEQVATGGPRGLDEEDEREMWCLKIERAVLQAIGQRESLAQEMELLQHALERRRQSGGATSSGRAPAALPADDPAMQRDRAAMMSKLSSIADALNSSEVARRRIQQNVLKPYHTLPTMTVQQAGEIEWQQAMAAEQRNREAEGKRGAKKQQDSDDDEEEVARQRAWDDWKDDNPRGMGNSKLRPTA